jgi:hypothetical protein
MSSLAWSLLFCLLFVGSCSPSQENLQFNTTQYHFRVLLRFAPKAEALFIEVQNTKTMEKYSSTIDQKYVDSKKELNGFTDPTELY